VRLVAVVVLAVVVLAAEVVVRVADLL